MKYIQSSYYMTHKCKNSIQKRIDCNTQNYERCSAECQQNERDEKMAQEYLRRYSVELTFLYNFHKDKNHYSKKN